MAKGPESLVKKWIVNRLNKEFKDHWRYMPPGGRFGVVGTPDFLICVNGVFVAIEAKAANGKLRDSQIYQISKLRRAGAVCCVLYGKDEERMSRLIKIIKQRVDSNGR